MSEKQLQVFRLVNGSPQRVADLSDFTQDGVASLAGVEAAIERRHYIPLVGLFPEIQTLESSEASDRFLVKVKHGKTIYIFLAQDLRQYSIVISFLTTNYSVLPELLLQEEKQTGFNSQIRTYYIPNGRRF